MGFASLSGFSSHIFNPFNPVLLKAELNAIIRLKKKKTREFEEQ